MGSLSIWHWLIVGAVVLLVFGGRNKISEMSGDGARGNKALKKGMADDETADAAKSDAGVKTIDHQASADIKRRAESESKVQLWRFAPIAAASHLDRRLRLTEARPET